MTTLALDPAKFTGFCIDLDTAPGVPTNFLFGVWNLGSGPGRLNTLRRNLEGMRERFPGLECVAYEIAAMGARGFRAVHAHAALCAEIEAFCEDRKLKCWGFHIGSWKAIALGQGNAKPERYRELLALHYGHQVSTCDEAAAISIWYAASKGPPPVTKKKQAKQVKKRLAKRQRNLFR